MNTDGAQMDTDRSDGKIRKNILLIICLFFAGAFASLCYGPISTYIFAKRAEEPFSQRICDNLVNAGYVNASDCLISEEAPDVMNAMFPDGVTIEYVFAGMQGFEKGGEISSNSSSRCEGWHSVRYIIAYGRRLVWGEYYEFIFCDDILVDKYWDD